MKFSTRQRGRRPCSRGAPGQLILDRASAQLPPGRVAISAVVLGILAGCAGGGSDRPTSPEAAATPAPATKRIPPLVHDCNERLLGTPSDPSQELQRSGEARLYVARLRGGVSFRLVAFLRLPGNLRIGEARYTSWKAPLQLSAGDDVEVSVAAGDRGSARFHRHHAKSFAGLPYRMVLHACAKDISGSARRTGWAGAIITRRSAVCVRLDVKDLASDDRRRLGVALGQKCS